MPKIEEIIEFIACPNDFSNLQILNDELFCPKCKNHFKIIDQNILELLPNKNTDIKTISTTEEYSKWYSNLLSGNQYSVEHKKKHTFVSDQIPKGFDNELISKVDIDKNGILCEIGSGIRALSLEYAKKSKLVIHTDLDLEDIKKSKIRAKKLGLENIFYILCDYFNLPFKNESLSNIVNTGVLGRHGQQHDAKLLSEISRVSKNQSTVILDFRSKERNSLLYAKKNDDNSVQNNELSSILKKYGLKIEKVSGIGFIPQIMNFSEKNYYNFNRFAKIFLPPSRWIIKSTKI